MGKPQKDLTTYNIGDIVKFNPKYIANGGGAIGIILGYNEPYYNVRWFDDRVAHGGYLWQNLDKI